MVPEGIPIPKGTPLTQPLFVATPLVGASSSQPVLQEEEEEEEEEEKGSGGTVDLTDSLYEFEMFNQPPSPKDMSKEMGIQRKPQKSLMELIEDQPGRDALVKSIQPKLPQPPQPIRPEPTDPKRRREQKGKEVFETRRSRPTREEEAQQATKQQKVSHMSQ